MTTLPFPLIFFFFRLTLFVDHMWPEENAAVYREDGTRGCSTVNDDSCLTLAQTKADVYGNLLETLELPAERIQSPLQRRLSVSLIKNICLDDTVVSPAKCGRVICTRKSGEERKIRDGLFNFSFAEDLFFKCIFLSRNSLILLKTNWNTATNNFIPFSTTATTKQQGDFSVLGKYHVCIYIIMYIHICYMYSI